MVLLIRDIVINGTESLSVLDAFISSWNTTHFLTGFILSLVLAALAWLPLRAYKISGSIFILFFGSFIYLTSGVHGFMLFFPFVVFDIIFIKIRQWKIRKASVNQMDVRRGWLNIIAALLYVSYLSLQFLRGLYTFSCVQGWENIYISYMAGSVTATVSYMASTEISSRPESNVRLTFWGVFAGLVVALIICIIHITTLVFPSYDFSFLRSHQLILMLLAPFSVCIIAHTVAAIFNLNSRSPILVFLISVSGGLILHLYLGSAHMIFRYPASEMYLVSILPVVILIIALFTKTMTKAGFVSCMIFCILLFLMQGSPVIIPFILFLIIDSFSTRVYMSRRRKTAKTSDQIVRLESKHVVVGSIIATVMQILFLATGPNANIIYIGLVATLASTAYYSISRIFIDNHMYGKLMSMISGVLVSGVIAWLSFEIFYMPVMIPGLFMIYDTTMFFTFVVIVIAVISNLVISKLFQNINRVSGFDEKE